MNQWEDVDFDHPRELLPFQLTALAFAKDQIGVEEITTNSSPMIDEYLAATDLNPGFPWCAAFVNWCAEQAARIHDTVSPLEEVPLQAYVPSYVNWAEDNDKIVEWDDVELGDLFCLYYPHLDRYGHMGFVYGVYPDEGTFDTIEGNTNLGGGREGTLVAQRLRHAGPKTIFIRYADDD